VTLLILCYDRVNTSSKRHIANVMGVFTR